ncbi:MAG: AbrB/MazE/SpoVT family DNA-binding domain-containing protein [Pseudomonadota bacterium]
MRTEYSTTINENGRVVIPALIRKELNLQAGDELMISISDEKDIIFHSPKQSLRKLQNIVKSKNKKNLTDKLIDMRKNEKL